MSANGLFIIVAVWGLSFSRHALPMKSPTADRLPYLMSPEEQRSIEARLQRFYSDPANPDVMMERMPKYDAATGRQVHLHDELRLSAPGATPDPKKNTLQSLAQKKGTEAYRKWYCKSFLEKHFPGFGCENTWSSVEEDDKLVDLAATWIPSEELVYDLDRIPTEGETAMTLWSDDYWRTRWGGTSFRYLEKKSFTQYRDAIADYAQPVNWVLVAPNPVRSLLGQIVRNWSPAEKYDLTLHDDKFSLTQQQKKLGERSAGATANVEEWEGICHGWAPAAIMVPRPVKPVEMPGKGGVKVTWHPHDIRAIASLAWAVGNSQKNFAGARCYIRDPRTYSNGRIVDQNCFDTNPATFHLALGNLIGIKKFSFIMDKTFDYEVWNQPIHSYGLTYFNPLKISEKSKDWKQVAVDYNDEFKAVDRFQTPATRGIRAVPPDDGKIKKIVGVIATVAYLAEISPQNETAQAERIVRVTYHYDLELEKEGELYVARGGEWHTNAHPDFLWVPRRNEVAVAPKFDEQARGEAVTSVAPLASAEGFPLCTVVADLVKQSAESSSYACPQP